VLPLIVLRPEPGCAASVSAARAMGLEAHGFPLFEVVPCDWEPVPPDSFDALLLGSANALRHGGEALARYRGKPACVVGARTAEAARAAGLDVVAIGSGGLQGVLDALPPGLTRLLRLAGAERVALTPPPGITIVERVVYESRARQMPDALARLLRAPEVVLLHSGEAARHFAAECDRLGVARAALSLATIGPRVTGAAGQGWARVETAESPDDTALLALAREMCQTGA
jgi:uroporphyrinogen-III synthase